MALKRLVNRRWNVSFRIQSAPSSASKLNPDYQRRPWFFRGYGASRMAARALAFVQLGILASAMPARAQINRAASVCVAFEQESVPLPRPVGMLLEHHTQLVWRIGVEPINLDDKERLEEILISRLDGRVYVVDGGSCVWSDPDLGQNHLVVIAYEGVVLLDSTVDPDDPRFQAFAIGYGSNWQEAEAEAVAKARLKGYYPDGLGHEIVVREAWDALPGAPARAGQARWEEPTAEDPNTAVEPLAGSMESGTRFRDCDVCPEMVVVPAGSFAMGSPLSEQGRWENEGPQHRVTIASAFAVGVYEVTRDEWLSCERAGSCDPLWESTHDGRYPACHVEWPEAQAYVRWLSQATGKQYRLLSEAEWEYVARGGTETPYYWGEAPDRLCRFAHTDDCPEPEGGFLRPVGSLEPNPFGLFDVLGNAIEWTQDCWNSSYSGAPTDGSAWETGESCYDTRVLRGGSAFFDAEDVRSAARQAAVIWNASYSHGFRVARNIN